MPELRRKNAEKEWFQRRFLGLHSLPNMQKDYAFQRKLAMTIETYEIIYNIGFGDALFSLSTTPPGFIDADRETLWYDTIDTKFPNIFKEFFKLKEKTYEIKRKILSGGKPSEKDYELSELYAALAEKLSDEFQENARRLEKIL